MFLKSFKIAICIISIVLIGDCTIQSKNEEEQIIKACANFYLEELASTRAQIHGIGLIVNDSAVNLNEFFSKIKTVDLDVNKFSNKIKDSVLRNVFDYSNLDHYIEQLETEERLDLTTISFENDRIKVKSDNTKEWRNSYKIYMSKPLLSLDKQYGLIFTLTGGHVQSLLVFQRNGNNWKYQFSSVL